MFVAKSDSRIHRVALCQVTFIVTQIYYLDYGVFLSISIINRTNLMKFQFCN